MYLLSERNILVAGLVGLLGALCGVAQAQITLTFSSFEPTGASSTGSVAVVGIVGQPEGASQSQGGFDRLLHGAALPGDVPLADPANLGFAVEDLGDNSSPRLSWMTSTEGGLLGFDIYRAVDTGASYAPGERLTSSPVSPTGTPSSGATYEFLDPAVFPHGSGDRVYLLAVIDLLGGATLYGEVLLSDPGITTITDWQTLNH